MDYALFDSLFDGVVVCDHSRRILYCNEAAAALAGSSVRRLTKGVAFESAFWLEDQELFPISGGPKGKTTPFSLTEMEFRGLAQNRHGRLQISVQPFREGDQERWIVLMRDVTLEATLHRKYQAELEQKEDYIRQLQHAKAQLEQYSKNLESMVQERTAELARANRLLRAMMDSLGQGFIVFDRSGVCNSLHTKACEEIMEVNPSGLPIAEVLRISEKERKDFDSWVETVFAELLPFDSLLDLAPKIFPHSKGKHIVLNFYPIREDDDSIVNVVVVATDLTRQKEAEVALERERAHVHMVLKAIKNRDQFSSFVRSLEVTLRRLRDLTEGTNRFDRDELFRLLHTLEGEAGVYGLLTLREASRSIQQTLGQSQDVKQISSALTGLDQAVAEFMAEHDELLKLIGFGQGLRIEMSLAQAQKHLELLTTGNVIRARDTFKEEIFKQPLHRFLSHLDEVARSVAEKLGKQVAPIEFDCGRVRIAPGDYGPLIASLVHALRNAVDHGLEDPSEREMAGKDPQGHIRISAETFMGTGAKSWIRLQISDDGRGFDVERLRRKLTAKYPGENFSRLSDADVIQEVFRPGFSSRDEVGAFSGRGVGMDAIKTEVERLGGRVWFESTHGQGTRLMMEIPEGLNEASDRLAS